MLLSSRPIKRKRILSLLVYIFFLLIIYSFGAGAGQLSGRLTVEGRLFAKNPLYRGQTRDNASLTFQPEFYQDWENSGFTFVPFLRIDSGDSKRSHYDIRELNMFWVGERWEVRVGIGRVFWGVTESQHLVDIINQTDLVESLNGEEKLGQPMINLSLPSDWGTFDFFILPYFRERTFPGRKGRLRFSPVIDTGQALYESKDKEHHLDTAVRYSHTIGDWDIGISHFRGTNREPTLLLGLDDEGDLILIPFYEQIGQTGLDLQLVIDEWLWKLEAIYRSGQGDEDFYALTAGFEYTFSGVGGGMDIGVMGEWLYDERGEAATTPLDNDIMLGMRIALNDIASTQILMGIIQDYQNNSQMLTLELSRRLGERWKIEIEAFFILNPPSDDLLYGLRDDNHLRIDLAYYF